MFDTTKTVKLQNRPFSTVYDTESHKFIDDCLLTHVWWRKGCYVANCVTKENKRFKVSKLQGKGIWTRI